MDAHVFSVSLSICSGTMDGRQAARQDGAGPSSSSSMRKPESALELDEKMKKIDMRPPSAPALSLLAKNTALLPSGIVRVKQLRDAALNQPPVNVAGPSSSVASGSATGESLYMMLILSLWVFCCFFFLSCFFLLLRGAHWGIPDFAGRGLRACFYFAPD